MIQLLKTLIAVACILLPIFACSPSPLPPVDHGELKLDTSSAFQTVVGESRWISPQTHSWTVKVQRGRRYEITLKPLIPPEKSMYIQMNLMAWVISRAPCDECRFDVEGDVRDSLTLAFVARGDQMAIQTYSLAIPCFIEIREIPM